MIKGGVASDLGAGRTLIAVPSNVGPRTMPNYDDLARKGIYELGNGIRVFAGTADDPFYIALGAAFDTLNFYQDAYSSGVAGVLSDAQDAQDSLNFAADDVSGFNVNVIAIEVPISPAHERRAASHVANDPKAVLGTYGKTSRPRIKVQPIKPGGPAGLSSNFVQLQRMGNPLINELIIGTGDKNKFSMSAPKDDSSVRQLFPGPAAGARDQRGLRRRSPDSRPAAQRFAAAGAVHGADLPVMQPGPHRGSAASQYRYPSHGSGRPQATGPHRRRQGRVSQRPPGFR